VQILLVRAALLLAVMLGLRERWRLAYQGALLGLLADGLLALALLITGYLGPVAALGNLLLALIGGLLLYGVSSEFAVSLERVLVRPDPAARSALDYYKRGHHYRQRGMWALAVAQWRRAVGLAPQVPAYYKHLGLGYAQIGRLARSLRALEEAQHQDPANAELAEIMALVRSKAGAQAGQTGMRG
jgi:tetratricopeptide (TPR) repeat protein